MPLMRSDATRGVVYTWAQLSCLVLPPACARKRCRRTVVMHIVSRRRVAFLPAIRQTV